MRYEPRAPREGINVSQEHPAREAVTLVAGLAAVLVAAGLLIGLGVDLAIPLIPPEFESRVFPAPQSAPPDESPRRSALQKLLERLASHWPDSPYRFGASLLEAEELNAAALPGGTIVVTTGLLDAVGSENELAFVLGHELGHFHGRHHLRRLGRRFVYGLALAAVLRRGTAGDVGSLVGELTSRGFDRGQENEADAFGLRLLAQEYGHVAGAADLFQHLPGGGPGLERLAAYLSTHPAGLDRAAELADRAWGSGWSSEGERRPLAPDLASPRP